MQKSELTAKKIIIKFAFPSKREQKAEARDGNDGKSG